MAALEGLLPLGPNLKVAVRVVSGPTSYTTGGFTVTFHELNSIDAALVVIANNPGNLSIQFD